jgi:aspartate racemase
VFFDYLTPMKTLGIVGGIGPESTIEYYRFILDGCRARLTDRSAHLIIDSLDVNRGIGLLDANDLAGLIDYVSSSVERLTRAGAELALMAANTPHIVFDEIAQRASVPMISIVQATCDYAQAHGFKRLGLLGTGFTMRARFYPDLFARAGLELVVPKESEQTFIHEKYIRELLKNQFKADTCAALIAIVERMREEDKIQATILAGTELPLLLRRAEPEGMEFLDTTAIHVGAAVEAILS